VTTKNAARSAIAGLYGLAIVISIFTGGFIWVVIVGAIVAGFAYRFTAGSPEPGVGRNRQRNRQRNRS
jgi:hypothetical protein